MFPQFDNRFFEQFASNPATFLAKIAEFQRANFEAARKIAENNVKAFQEMASVSDPQTFMQMQPAILQAVIQENADILTGLWRSLGADLPTVPPGKK
ncbi:MAG: phasin family protein [Magnetospirillum sp.]|nr:phasin family protein [Magnetospirillum sp.]